jgi:type II secretory pathway pseudopilin PulG
MKLNRRNVSGRREAGFSLVELLIALAMLVVGMAGIVILVVTAMTTNNRTKNDTSATTMAQMVLSQIAAFSANSTNNPIVTDCGGTQWTINTAVGGSDMVTSSSNAPTRIGDIDWNSSTTTYSTLSANKYAMRYKTCSGDTYEIRWNVHTLTTLSNQVAVSARVQQAASGNTKLAQLQYGTPVTLRSIVGN